MHVYDSESIICSADNKPVIANRLPKRGKMGQIEWKVTVRGGQLSSGIMTLETIIEGVTVNVNNPKELGKNHEKLLGEKKKNNKHV